MNSFLPSQKVSTKPGQLHPYGDLACRLSPSAAEEKAQQDAYERFLKGKGTLRSSETEPFVTVFFRDDKLSAARVEFIAEKLGLKTARCSGWPAVRDAMTEKYGAPSDRDTEIQYDNMHEQAVDRERLYWSGGKAVASLYQFEEKLYTCPALIIVSKDELERSRREREAEKEKVKAKF